MSHHRSNCCCTGCPSCEYPATFYAVIDGVEELVANCGKCGFYNQDFELYRYPYTQWYYGDSCVWFSNACLNSAGFELVLGDGVWAGPLVLLIRFGKVSLEWRNAWVGASSTDRSAIARWTAEIDRSDECTWWAEGRELTLEWSDSRIDRCSVPDRVVVHSKSPYTPRTKPCVPPDPICGMNRDHVPEGVLVTLSGVYRNPRSPWNGTCAACDEINGSHWLDRVADCVYRKMLLPDLSCAAYDPWGFHGPLYLELIGGCESLLVNIGVCSNWSAQQPGRIEWSGAASRFWQMGGQPVCDLLPNCQGDGTTLRGALYPPDATDAGIGQRRIGYYGGCVWDSYLVRGTVG